MEQGAQLLTILHISDLHIGHIDSVTGNAEFAPSFAKLVAQFTWFDGRPRSRRRPLSATQHHPITSLVGIS
jgi:hypothetical protein